MAYISKDELIAQFGADSLEGMTDAQIEQVLAGVDALINSKLVGVYTVPFIEPYPVLIKEIAVDLARYSLQDANVYDEVKNKGLKERYDYALQTLQRLANGDMKLTEIGVSTDQPILFVSAPSRNFGVF